MGGASAPLSILFVAFTPTLHELRGPVPCRGSWCMSCLSALRHVGNQDSRGLNPHTGAPARLVVTRRLVFQRSPSKGVIGCTPRCSWLASCNRRAYQHQAFHTRKGLTSGYTALCIAKSPLSLGELPHLGDGRGLGPAAHPFTAFAATSQGLLHMVLRHAEGSRCLSCPPALRQVGT